MSTLTIKNIPGPLLDRLRDRAEAEHRSINRQVISILEGALPARSERSFRAVLEEYYAKWGSPRLTDDEVATLRDRSEGKDGG